MRAISALTAVARIRKLAMAHHVGTGTVQWIKAATTDSQLA